MLKKIVSLLIVICLIFTLFSGISTISAEKVHKGKISIDKVSAVTGDTIIVPIRITENPGLMATTISITYDSSALEFNYYYKGNILRDYTVVAHPNKNIIRFVNCESADKTSDGVLVNLQFIVKDTAEAGFHEMSVQYNAGDFCNWDLDKIMPEIIPGGVDVAFNGNNCTHKKYNDWTVAAEPTCEENGANQRICKTCGHIELKSVEPFGHTYSDKWTVDRPATAEQDGIMTRYCIWCNDYVDRITFSLEQAKEDNIKNQENAENSNTASLENIFKEQNPNKELTQSRPLDDNKKNENSNSSVSDSTDNTIGSTIGESNTESNAIADLTVMDKIAEVLPNFKDILNIFKISIAILMLLVI